MFTPVSWRPANQQRQFGTIVGPSALKAGFYTVKVGRTRRTVAARDLTVEER
jgi:hypothetical protein